MAEQGSTEPPKTGFFVAETIGLLSTGKDLTFNELFRIQEQATQYEDIRAIMSTMDYELQAADALRNASPHSLQMLLINILKATDFSKSYASMPQNNRPAETRRAGRSARGAHPPGRGAAERGRVDRGRGQGVPPLRAELFRTPGEIPYL
jgi:hypothetical protein